ncbi:uncharacterized protein G2W53_029153 [Senna tora]|uniref:Uncharacterized protein n=1 Tax=Senna tora TaxID=362788 RepID=A0A834T3N6_9FABA|nr:uncharacterized protein G2W53_029153 [Senna tora]
MVIEFMSQDITMWFSTFHCLNEASVSAGSLATPVFDALPKRGGGGACRFEACEASWWGGLKAATAMSEKGGLNHDVLRVSSKKGASDLLGTTVDLLRLKMIRSEAEEGVVVVAEGFFFFLLVKRKGRPVRRV